MRSPPVRALPDSECPPLSLGRLLRPDDNVQPPDGPPSSGCSCCCSAVAIRARNDLEARSLVSDGAGGRCISLIVRAERVEDSASAAEVIPASECPLARDAPPRGDACDDDPGLLPVSKAPPSPSPLIEDCLFLQVIVSTARA
mmetsp:Transcript_33001/g.59145  ORF Transcript_33001/g.59145 Transcript_33001/m.59145 type:complete len:143 (-) Transcript_33001:422-850(-)